MIANLVARLGASRPMRRLLRFGLAATAVLLLLGCRRAGERLGRLLEQRKTLERSNAVQREMLDAAVRPRDRDELAKRLRDGRF